MKEVPFLSAYLNFAETAVVGKENAKGGWVILIQWDSFQMTVELSNHIFPLNGYDKFRPQWGTQIQ